MNIISWNVNGIRAINRKGNFQWLIDKKADIFCLQETKAHVDQLEDGIRNIPEYQSFFVSPAEKKGYSGVAVYTKVKPLSVEFGLGVDGFDSEGRLIQVEYKDFFLLNGYFPNGGGGPDRLKYKLEYYDVFLKHVVKLKKKKAVIFCGDINTAHEEIDLARPKANEKNTGFLPEERAWIDEVINHGFVDIFRFLNPRKKDIYTYWDMKTSSRDRNVGWRIDYFFISQDIVSKVKDTIIHDEVLGSDHCPIELIM